MNETDSVMSETALEFVRRNKQKLYDKFCSRNNYPGVNNPLTIMMAGSPGAGKTEYSKVFIPILEARYPEQKIVRIDADDVRKLFDDYNGKNSYIFQSACSVAVAKIFEHVLKYKQHCVLDGTLASYSIANTNIERSLSRDRSVGIVYIYLDPLIAWEYTKAREKEEGRMIPKAVFIEDYFKAQENANRLKKQYGDKIDLSVVIKDGISNNFKSPFNVSGIDLGSMKEYTIGSLNKLLN